MTGEMTSRERVIAALERRTPDRVPIDLGGNQSGIHVNAYKRLIDYVGIPDEHIMLSNFSQLLAQPRDAVLERLHVDTRWIRPGASPLPLDRLHDHVQHEQGHVGRYDAFHVFWGVDASKTLEDVLYFSPVIPPLADATSVHDIEAFPWPRGDDPALFKDVQDQARNLHRGGSHAIVSTTIGNTIELCTHMFGIARAMKLVRTKPELLDAAMDHLVEYWNAHNTTLLGLVGEHLDVACITGDLAGQHGPLTNPAFYEKHVKPRDKAIAMHAKRLAPHLKLNYHSCGSIVQHVPFLVDNGYASINPVQVSAHDMEPCSLVRRFGDSITFWGGLCNSQSTLPFDTPVAVAEEVRHNVACFKSGPGGYIAANVHNITAEVPAANIVTMFDTTFSVARY